jgi:hypothetical protein
LSAIARPPGSRCAPYQINNRSTSSLTPPHRSNLARLQLNIL